MTGVAAPRAVRAAIATLGLARTWGRPAPAAPPSDQVHVRLVRGWARRCGAAVELLEPRESRGVMGRQRRHRRWGERAAHRRRLRRGHTPDNASASHRKLCDGYVVDTPSRTPDTCRYAALAAANDAGVFTCVRHCRMSARPALLDDSDLEGPGRSTSTIDYDGRNQRGGADWDRDQEAHLLLLPRLCARFCGLVSLARDACEGGDRCDSRHAVEHGHDHPAHGSHRTWQMCRSMAGNFREQGCPPGSPTPRPSLLRSGCTVRS